MGFGGISTNGMLACPGGCTISTFHQANLNGSLGRVGLNWRF